MEPQDMVSEAADAEDQAHRAAGLLLRHGFNRRNIELTSRRWSGGR